jgi:hypothetical protein
MRDGFINQEGVMVFKTKLWLALAAFSAALLFAGPPVLSAETAEQSKLKNNLKAAVRTLEGERIKQALIPLIQEGGRSAVIAICEALNEVPQKENLVYWQLVNALTTLVDDEAFDAIADVILEGKFGALSRDIIFALQNIRCAGVYRLYGKVLPSAPPDVQKMITDAIVNLDDPNMGIEVLMSALEKSKDRDKVFKGVIIDALISIAGYNLGDKVEDWLKWWDVTKAEGGVKRRDDSDKQGGCTGTAVDEMDRARRDKLFGGEDSNLPKIKVLVIHCTCKVAGEAVCFDRIQAVTQRMQIETVVVDRADFEGAGYKIDDSFTAVLIDCTQIKDHCICPKCHPGSTKQDRLHP